MAARREALTALREYLEVLPGTARVRLRRAQHNWSHTWPWPGPGAARGVLFNQIRRALEALEGGGEVEVLPEGMSDSALFSWPAMPGLFVSADDQDGQGPRPRENRTLPQLPAPVTRPAKASEACALHVEAALFALQQRRTAAALEKELLVRGHEWSLSTVEATCTWMTQTGRLDSGRDRRGKGYGLLDWDSLPEGAILDGD